MEANVSSPPTPRRGDYDPRFKSITLPCEWIENYHPGGYHPVNLGDIFHNGQYQIIRKLGEGSYSTVWLVRDIKNNVYAALKILVSEISESTKEAEILQHICRTAGADQYVTRLLDKFEHGGPNGTHKCLVFEPMGPSVNSMVRELPQFKPRTRGMKIRYPLWMAKRILKHSLEALAFLHERGIAHGDFQPGNMLFGLDNIDSIPEETLQQTQGASVSAVQRLDGKQDRWAPQYLYVAQTLVPYSPYDKDFRIKLSDMGGAYFFADSPKNPVTPLGLRSPELVLHGSVNPAGEIWSFGCLIFELVTGRPLLCIPGSDDEKDDYMLNLIEALGKPPNSLFDAWETSSRYFTPDGRLFNCHLGGVPEGEEPLMLEQVSIEELFDQVGLTEVGEEEGQQIKALVRQILQYDSVKRPSAKELLKDPWFL